VANQSFWVYNEKYQPSTIDELALYPALNRRLRKYAHTQHFPNLMMYGAAGTGKTTAAKILANSVKSATIDMFDFGGNRGVDEIRKFISFTTTKSLFSSGIGSGSVGRVFILDEFHDVSETNQRMIKKVIEDRDIHRYIFCVNDVQAISAPIVSRCSLLQFDYCELDILGEANVLPHTGWDTINDWVKELKRVATIMAAKAGKTITDSQYDRVFSRGERIINVRSFILALEEVITDDEFEADERRKG